MVNRYALTLIVVLYLSIGNVSYAHQMFRDSEQEYQTYANKDEFYIKNDYDFAAEFSIEVFDKNMEAVDSDEWRSNVTDNTIRQNPGSVKTIKLRFRPNNQERKYYVCTKLQRAQDLEINVLSRICLRLLIHPTIIR